MIEEIALYGMSFVTYLSIVLIIYICVSKHDESESYTSTDLTSPLTSQQGLECQNLSKPQ